MVLFSIIRPTVTRTFHNPSLFCRSSGVCRFPFLVASSSWRSSWVSSVAWSQFSISLLCSVLLWKVQKIHKILDAKYSHSPLSLLYGLSPEFCIKLEPSLRWNIGIYILQVSSTRLLMINPSFESVFLIIDTSIPQYLITSYIKQKYILIFITCS